MANRYPSPNSKYPFVGDNYRKYGEVPGYVYYPYNDQYYIDPRAVKNQYTQEGLIEEPKQPSLADQILPGVAVVGGAAAAKEIGSSLPGLVKDAVGIGSASEVAGTAGTAAATGGAGSTAGTALGATQLPSFGYEAPAFGLDAAGGAGAAAAGEAAASPFALGGFGSAGNYLAPGLGLIGAADLFINKREGARGVLQGAASGAGIGSFFNPVAGGLPVGTIVGAGIGGLAGGLNSLLAHESTKDYKNRKAAGLIDMGFTPEQVQSNFYDPKADDQMWKRIKDTAMKNPLMVWDSTGMKETFGPEYFTKMNEFERFAAAQYAVDKGLVGGKKGIIDIKDKDALKSGYGEYVSNPEVQARYNAYKKWQAENPGKDPMAYFDYNEYERKKAAQRGYTIDESQLAGQWTGPQSQNQSGGLI
jgi:hypothetical protein